VDYSNHVTEPTTLRCAAELWRGHDIQQYLCSCKYLWLD